MEKIDYLLWKLTSCQGIGPRGIWKIIQFGQAHDHWDFTASEILRIAQIKKYQERFLTSWQKINPDDFLQQRFITILDEGYPELLKEISDPPPVLFFRGNLQLLQTNLLAVVGARDASKYGKEVVKKLIPELVDHNYTIVSGLAKGIDGCAHYYTLQTQGNTIAVIGTGVDICYPRETGLLHLEMAKKMLVLSEYPDGTPPARHHFPQRNRIIAGLAQGTCVVEAKKRSGSLITAQLALEYGREVFAVPGNILTEGSRGCHQLIQDGAKCVDSITDILEELKHFS